MTLVIPPGTAQVIHSLTLAADAEPMAVTHAINWIEPDPPVLTLMADMAAELHDAFGDTVMGAVCNVYTLTSTELRYVPYGGAIGDDPTLAIATGSRVGAQPGGSLPQNSALLVHKRTPRSGRRGRGRMFIPGIPEGDVTQVGGVTTVAGWQTALTAFRTRILGWSVADMIPILLHSTSPSIPLPTDPRLTPDVCTAFQVDPVIATQRRRLRR